MSSFWQEICKKVYGGVGGRIEQETGVGKRKKAVNPEKGTHRLMNREGVSRNRQIRRIQSCNHYHCYQWSW